MTLMNKWYIKFVILCLVILTVIAVSVEIRAGREFRAGQRAMIAGDVKEAITYFSRSLMWYIPYGSSETAAEELLQLGLQLSRQGQTELAQRALVRVRAGLYGARWLYTPRMDLIREAEPVLAQILAKQKLGPNQLPELLESKREEYLSLMRQPSRPSTLTGLAASIGFVGWATAIFFFIFRFFHDQSGGWMRAWPYALMWGLFFGVWLWGLKWA